MSRIIASDGDPAPERQKRGASSRSGKVEGNGRKVPVPGDRPLARPTYLRLLAPNFRLPRAARPVSHLTPMTSRKENGELNRGRKSGWQCRPQCFDDTAIRNDAAIAGIDHGLERSALRSASFRFTSRRCLWRSGRYRRNRSCGRPRYSATPEPDRARTQGRGHGG